jgi:hypothetical protein
VRQLTPSFVPALYRSIVHLARLFVLADEAALLRNPELASERMRRVLGLAGVD